jgi:hypothetical protein
MIAKKCALALAAIAFMRPVLAHADEGRPVTAADLSGKTICWSGDLQVTYRADGTTSSNHRGHLSHSIWSVPEPGLVRFRNHYRPMLVLPDGRFQTHVFLGKSGGSLTSADIYTDHWGAVCN